MSQRVRTLFQLSLAGTGAFQAFGLGYVRCAFQAQGLCVGGLSHASGVPRDWQN